VLIALRAPAVAADVRAALAHGLRLPWLGAAAAAEAICVAGLVMAQRQLLAAAGARLPVRAVAAAVVASTGLARLLPAGPAAAAAWQAGQYRRRDPAGGTAGVWAVLAGGVASTAAALAVLAAGAAAAARWWLLAGGAATLAVVTAAALAARRAGAAARWLTRHAGRSRWRWLLAAGLAGLARHRLEPRQGAAVLAASGLSVLGEAGLLAAAFAVAGTPVPWRGLLLAGAAGQLGARLVPLPGGLGGVEGGVLGALALTGTHPATALTAVIIYRVTGYWTPGAAGAITAAVLTRRHPARAARPPAPLRPQAPPPPAPGQPPSPRLAASAAGARAARPWPAPGRPARPGLKPARAHPTAGPASRTPQAAAGHAASARSPPEPGATGPAARHGNGPRAPSRPVTNVTARQSSSADRTKRRKEHVMNTPLTHRPDGNGASAEAIPAAAGAADGYPLPVTWHGVGAQAAASLGMLTGLWVAISPWFITLQYAGGNATAVNLISGLAVAAVGAFALAGPRGFAGLQSGSALLGVWLIIAGPILNHKHPIADSMYWSNSWAGGVLIALAAASLAAVALRRPARR
jgi:hypothetical protein